MSSLPRRPREHQDGAAAASGAFRAPERARIREALGGGRRPHAGQHPVPCALSLSLLFFMAVEYTLAMVPAFCTRGRGVRADEAAAWSARRPAEPQLGPGCTQHCVRGDANCVHSMDLPGGRAAEADHRRSLHVHVPGNPRLLHPAAATGGILGLRRRLPRRQRLLLPLLSGHVGGSVIASQDMRRARRRGLARTFDVLNVLQVVRLLATRGHYTIDLAAGLGAGFLFDALAGNYEEWKEHRAGPAGKL
ncbi:phosphatidylcholine:diacylglycerol cholinephosphotransferase 1-like [Iris pallida]|uniref:Phosphatidylcholine:diacylglycerol cholinephosphotransferase 1-like n=1 Tax=Iris pallida TaxID=29817 RepID=A0AAX6IBU6_IRIPA|nr:phosphatidylcholine:diacylglycerol cholinephosphotransferase 1-like [Iris pallida]